MKILYTALSLALPIVLATTTETAPKETAPKEKSTDTRPRQEALIVGPTTPTKVDFLRVYDLSQREAPFLSSLPSITLPASTIRAPQLQAFFSWTDLIEANKEKLEKDTDIQERVTKLAFESEDYLTQDNQKPDTVIEQALIMISKSPAVTKKGEEVFTNEVLEVPRKRKSRFSIQMVVGRPQEKAKVSTPETAAPKEVPKETAPVQSAPPPTAQPEEQSVSS